MNVRVDSCGRRTAGRFLQNGVIPARDGWANHDSMVAGRTLEEMER